MDPMDMPDNTPSLTVTVTFPEGSTAEEITAGRGAVTTMTGAMIPPGAIVTAMLRAAEAALASHVREQLVEQISPLTAPPTGSVLDSIVTLNARLGLISTVTDMEFVPSETIGFSVDE